MSLARNIGISVKAPETVCEDGDCPYHGRLSVRGVLLKGRVLKNKMNKTVVVEREHQIYVRKYKRYLRRRSRVSAHLPPCVKVEVGDQVLLGECRPLSKTVSFVVLGRVG